MDTKHAEDCMVCGRELNHLNQATQSRCIYCGNNEGSYFICPEGHFVCNTCHTNEAILTLSRYCLTSKSINPLEMLEELMQCNQTTCTYFPVQYFRNLGLGGNVR